MAPNNEADEEQSEAALNNIEQVIEVARCHHRSSLFIFLPFSLQHNPSPSSPPPPLLAPFSLEWSLPVALF